MVTVEWIKQYDKRGEFSIVRHIRTNSFQISSIFPGEAEPNWRKRGGQETLQSFLPIAISNAKRRYQILRYYCPGNKISFTIRANTFSNIFHGIRRINEALAIFFFLIPFYNEMFEDEIMG